MPKSAVPAYSGLQAKWMPHPGQPAGPMPQSDACAFVQLPQTPAGGGYHPYGTRPGMADIGRT